MLASNASDTAAASRPPSKGRFEVGLRALESSGQSRSMYREIRVTDDKASLMCCMKIKLLLRTRNPRRWTLPRRGIFLRLAQVFAGMRKQSVDLHSFWTSKNWD